jgi:hypothetical protein
MKLKKLPIGLQTFGELINNDYLYIDKTQIIYELIHSQGRYFFLSRPRRFGKSLLISTLKDLFLGKKDLFKGLWLYSRLDWEQYHYAVIHIDLSQINYETPELLKAGLLAKLMECAVQYGVDTALINDYKAGFAVLIKQLAVEKQVVVLIDEYDKPIIDLIHKPPIALENRDVLRHFYSILKSLDEHLRFVLLTGVSKFSKVSVFSGLNNLNDISIDEPYVTLLGTTQAELEHYFSGHIDASCLQLQISRAQLLKDLREWYNGYSWNGKDLVYTPYSLLCFFEKNRWQNYWFSSGTPTFLIKLISEQQLPVAEFENMVVSDFVLESFDIDRIELTALLYQTGYLTIKHRYVVDGSARYELGYPNREVRESFINHLLHYFSRQPISRVTALADSLTLHLHHHRPIEFLEEMKAVFADIPYDLSKQQNEGYFHSIFYMCLRLLGTSVSCEIETNRGRIDAVIHTADHIYILEFKMGSGQEALEQIIAKGYAEKYRLEKKPLTLIGIGFDRNKRTISDWQMQQENEIKQ